MTRSIRWRFVREPDIATRIITWAAGDRRRAFSHVGALTDDGKLEFGARWRANGAPGPGVRFRPAGYALFTSLAIVEIPVSDVEHDEFWRLAIRVEGAPYSWRTVLGFVVGADLPERRVAFDCSTLQVWLAARAGILAPWFRDHARQISPDSLHHVAVQMRHERRSM